MQVVDRIIRESSLVPMVPAGALRGRESATIVAAVQKGSHDTHLGPMRAQEAAGAARPSVLEAIDARSREVVHGGA